MRLLTALSAISLVLGAVACAPSSSTPAAAAAVAPHFVAHFDPAAGELPEGLALSADAAFVGFAPSSRVVRVDLASGAAAPFGTLPAPVPNQGFMTGLARSPSGEIYAGLASFVPEVQAGVYRIPKDGGAATLFAKDSALPFPNALAFDADGTLWATDSGTGSVFHLAADGTAERWATGPALLGDKDACDKAGPGFAIGANGLVVEPDAIYVVNMDHATLLEIPREANGKASTPRVLAGPDCDALGGADGLTRAPDGSFVIAVNRQNKLMRVTRDGHVETLAKGAPFDFPATVAYEGKTLYATNFALKNASSGKPSAPGLLDLSHLAAR